MSIGRADADWVTDRVAVGADLGYAPDRALDQARDLAGAGITHVLDVRRERDDREWWEQVGGVHYHWDGIDDVGQRVPGHWFDAVVGWCLDALADPDARLLTHCAAGVNRGPSAGYAVLLAQGWDPVEAMEAIHTARPIAYVAYADDALHWHHERHDVSMRRRREEGHRLAAWRAEHRVDLVRILAQQEDPEA